MRFAPQRDWDFYRSIASQHDVSVERTPEERLQVYADFFNTVAHLRAHQPRSSAFDQNRWDEKLLVRRKVVAALQGMEKWNRETNAADRSA